jgi:DNA-binding MarR family transcriptional regulator
LQTQALDPEMTVTSTSTASRPRRSGGARLSGLELDAWRNFLRVHAMLTRELDDELRLAHGLPLTSYDVLVNLEGAPERQMRMSELADAVLLSRSGLTRLVERLERDGLLTRADCPGDARGSFAVLTDAGLARLAEARKTHLAGVRDRFLSAFSDDELERLGEHWRRLLEPAADDADA